MVLTKILRLLPSIGLAFWGLGVLYAATEPTVTVNVTANSYAVLPGETLTATVKIDVVNDAGCTVGMYRLSLNPTSNSVLTITSPSALGPPAPITSTFSLLATSVGTATLQAHFLSEVNCGFWAWKDYRGNSPAILVSNQLSKLYLPLMSR